MEAQHIYVIHGLILVDLINEDKDTYNTSEDVENNEINSCAFSWLNYCCHIKWNVFCVQK